MKSLQKVLDNTPKAVYNIFKKDGEGFDLSSIPVKNVSGDPFLRSGPDIKNRNTETLWMYYRRVRATYEADPSLFPTPPVFSGGFFRDLVWGQWPRDLDLFFNSHGMTKEEAEDNFCLFLHKLGIPFSEQVGENYINDPCVFRVFNIEALPNATCHLQVILKDIGPPEDDPLYVTNDFNYNHSRAALPVVGDPAITYHGHAVAGWENRLHVTYREGGLQKCKDFTYGDKSFKVLDLSSNYKTKPKSGIKLQTNPCSEIVEDKTTKGKYVIDWPRGAEVAERLMMENFVQAWAEIQPRPAPIAPPPLDLLEANRAAIQQRNQFVNQFDPLRNLRRPVP